MADFVEKLDVVEDGLALDPFGSNFLRMRGTIKCRGGIEIHVDKTIEVVDGGNAAKVHAGRDDGARVQTVRYNYQVLLHRGAGSVRLFRYDNADERDDHHKHTFDWPPRPRDKGERSRCAPDAPPTNAEVIKGAMDWYWEHHDELG